MSNTEAVRQANEVSLFASSSPGKLYGAEWGDPDTDAKLKPVLDKFMLPELAKRKRLCEIGSGGGRWSRYMIRACKPLLLIDGSPGSEVLIKALPWTDRAASALATNVEFMVAPSGTVPVSHHGQYDYVFSFDTFVHFDLSLFLNYLRTISLMLQIGGVLHLHYADMQQANWLTSLDSAAEWDNACRTFRYIGREDMWSLLSKFNLRRTDRDMKFGANGSRLIECLKVQNG